MRRAITIVALLLSLLASILVAPATAGAVSGYSGWAAGADWSWGKPSPESLLSSGVTFAMVYVSPTTSGGKYTSRAEVSRLTQAGIGVGPIYETTAARTLGGCEAGATDASRARSALVRLGIPNTTTVYGVAVDFDVQPRQYATVDAYADCFAATLGSKDLTGVYAHGSYISHAWNRGYTKLWQTYAWSHGRWSPRAVIRQVRNGVRLAGGTVDLDYSATPGYIGLYRPGTTPYVRRNDPLPVPDVKPLPRATTYTVRRGDTVSGVARRHGTTVAEISRCTGLRNVNVIRRGQVLRWGCGGVANVPRVAASSHPRMVTVRPGEYLAGPIARRCGTGWRTLAARNHVRGPSYVIRIGQRLRCS